MLEFRNFFVITMLTLLVLPAYAFGAESLSDRLAGKILLQVEANGEAWYLEPETKQRAFLGRPSDAFRVMRELGLGVSEGDYKTFKMKVPQRLAGRILLRVEANGEAYYVNPDNLELIFLNRPRDAFRVMREQGLGISNNDLDNIVLDKRYFVSDEIKSKITDFINNNLISAGPEISLGDVSFEDGMYKCRVILPNGQEVISYANEELTNFFPSAMDMKKKNTETKMKPSTTNSNNITKADKPKVELFVMSHCPYGTQMEKGLLPVLDTLGDAIDFELKFNDYAMHGKKELDEEMSQYCLQKNNPEKLSEYLYCFLEDETMGGSCLEQAGINISEHNTCVADINKEYKITENYNDKSTWKSGRFPVFSIFEDDNKTYGVNGSPTLIINGDKVQSSRDSQALLETICDRFSKQPRACQTDLSDVSPSPGFGFVGSGSSASTACGS